VTVRVTDDGVPPFNDSKTFTISVVGPPRVTSISVGSGSVNLSWTALDGKLYRVQYKNDLTDANWTDLNGDVTANGNTANKVDGTIGSAAIRFYRVELLP
jgi:hypothetical protein